MTITKKQNEAALEIAVNGRLDTNTAHVLDQEFVSALAGVSELTLDFAGLEYISSAGLRVLLSAQKTMSGQGSMKIKNVNELVMEIFEVTGFSDILTII